MMATAQALQSPEVRALSAHVRENLPDGASRLLIGLSGGRDSLALALAAAGAADGEALDVHLVHVNHQLQAEASAWVEHCRAFAAFAGLPLTVCDVDVDADGQGLEAAARHARYNAFEALMKAGDVLLTAHHQRDQAETVLLRLLRGAGVDGMSAMQVCRPFGPGWLCRPLLHVAPSELANATQAAGVEAVDDPSNRDTGLDRVFLREQVLPLLRTRWPAADQMLSRTAGLSQAAAEVVQARTRELMPALAGQRPGTLSRQALAGLSEAQAKAVLRAWLRSEADVTLDAGRTHDVWRLLTHLERPEPAFVHGPVAIRCYRDEAFLLSSELKCDAGLPNLWTLGAPLQLAHGSLSATRAKGAGLSPNRLARAALTLRLRRPGERVAFGHGGRHRSLKKQFQHWGVPPWERDRLPLVCIGDVVVCVPGHTTVGGYAAGRDEYGWLVNWEFHDAPG